MNIFIVLWQTDSVFLSRNIKIYYKSCLCGRLTYWGRVKHICVSNLTTIGSDNGLSAGRHQAIIWTNAGIMLIGPLGTNFIEILIRVQTFLFKKDHWEQTSVKS